MNIESRGRRVVMQRGNQGLVVAAALLVAAVGGSAGCASIPQPAGCICQEGRRQSPIDLGDARPAELPAIEFDYGETVEAEVFDTGKSVQVDFAAGHRPWIAVRGERFELIEFHFHEPAEHVVGSEEHAMELHFVNANQVGELAVVGVFLEDTAAEPQPAIARIWATVPERPRERARITLAPEELLPADRRYVRYAGSLTTGACAEGVRWHVLGGRLAVTPRQVEEYRHPNSARPVQALNGRPVLVGGS
jgi:carbonic anhydrase